MVNIYMYYIRCHDEYVNVVFDAKIMVFFIILKKKYKIYNSKCNQIEWTYTNGRHQEIFKDKKHHVIPLHSFHFVK
jgi:hypothetical protein